MYMRSPIPYSMLISTLGTPGNLIGKPVRISYKGNTLEDIKVGELSFLDSPNKKMEEARVAQTGTSIGAIHGSMPGDLNVRQLIHTHSEAHGEV